LLAAGEQAVLRIGWLDDSRSLDLTALRGRKVRLGGQLFAVDSVRAEHLSYRELLELPRARRVLVEFVSATYFSRSGLWYPLPDPRLVFGGLIRRWNQHCPPQHALTDTGDFLSRLAISAVSLTSTPVDPGRGLRIGFTGTCAFTIPEVPDPRHEALLATLAGFALTSGVGAQTTHGLGHVEVTLD
jgi:CRISPR-associated endoribonuclease Cas6